MERKVSIIEDLDGRKTVVIYDIKFKGKRNINWEQVKNIFSRMSENFII